MTRQAAPRRQPARARDLDARPASRSRLTGPVLLFLVIALVGSLAFLGWAVTVRDSLQVPMLATSAAIVGVVCGLWAIALAVATLRAGREDRAGRALLLALVGGGFAAAAFGALAAAAIFALIWRSAV